MSTSVMEKGFLGLGVFLKEAGVRGAGGRRRLALCRRGRVPRWVPVAERPVPESERTDGRGSPRPRRSPACRRGSVPALGGGSDITALPAHPSAPSTPRSRNLRSRPLPPPRSPEVGRAGPGSRVPGPKWPRTAKVTSGGSCGTWGQARTLRGGGGSNETPTSQEQ